MMEDNATSRSLVGNAANTQSDQPASYRPTMPNSGADGGVRSLTPPPPLLQLISTPNGRIGSGQ